MLDRLDHVNLVVADLSAMTAFYRDVLGLRVTKQVSISGPWIDAVTGFAEMAADVVYLEARAGSGLELICYRTPPGPRPAGLGEPNTRGIRHIAFGVSDLDASVRALRAAGVIFLSDVQRVPTEQVEYGGKQKRIVYCRDPEGNLLELCSFA